jgi:hypothetical protein
MRVRDFTTKVNSETVQLLCVASDSAILGVLGMSGVSMLLHQE